MNYASATSVGAYASGQVHQISLDWKDKRRCVKNSGIPRGISLRVSKEKALFLDVKDCATKLRIVAPSTTKMHFKGCGALKELDIDCPLLLDLVVGNSPSTIKKMVENLSKKSPWLKKVTIEM